MTENEKLNETQTEEEISAAEEIAEEATSADASAEESSAAQSKNKVSPNKPAAVKGKKPMSRKRKHALISGATCLLVIAAVILVNVIASALTLKLSGLTVDVTSKRSFEISAQTRDIAENVKNQVSITILSDRVSYMDYDPYCKQTAYMVEEMERASNGMIKAEYVDIVRNPTFVEKYPNYSLTKTDIIISCGDKYSVLPASELFSFETYYNEYQYIASSHAEEAIDNAIVTVTNDKVTNVALIRDYSTEDPGYFTRALTSSGYTVRELSLLSSDIPPETDMIVIYAPAQDFTEENTDKIRKFLINDGSYGKNVLFLSDTKDVQMPNLDKLLLEYGMELGHGFAFEADGSKINTNSTNYFDGVLCNYASTKYTELVADSGKPVITGYEKPVVISDLEICEPLLSYSEYSGICPFDAGDDWDYAQAITGYKTVVLARGASGTEEAGSNLIVSGSFRPFTQSYYGSDYANRLYLSTMLATISGRDTSRVTVTDKVITEFDLTIDRSTAVNLGFIVYAFIPILILGAGFVVFLMRRNR